MRIKYVYKCCIPQCKNIESKNLLKFFNLNYFDNNLKWTKIILTNIVNYSTQDKNKIYKICSEHFSDDDYDLVWDQTNGSNDGNNKILRKILKSTAIPNNYKTVEINSFTLGKEITILKLNKSITICDSNNVPKFKENKEFSPICNDNKCINLPTPITNVVSESALTEIQIPNNKDNLEEKQTNENDYSSDIEIIEETNLISSLNSSNIINSDVDVNVKDKIDEDKNKNKIVDRKLKNSCIVIDKSIEILFNTKDTEKKLPTETGEGENRVSLHPNKENSKICLIGTVYAMDLNKLKFICQRCNLNFRKLTQFNEHFENNHSIENGIEILNNLNAMKTRKSDKCAEIFLNLNETFLSCTYCQAKLISDLEILKHLEKNHSQSKDKSTLSSKTIVPAKKSTMKKSYKDNQLKNKINKNSDKQINRRPKKLQCTYCPKMFPCNFTLNNHIRTHTKERPFKCPDINCPKSFSTLFILENHKRIHTGERPYKCDKCDFKFLRRSNLSAHFKAIHSNVKKYKCPDCEKAFPLKDRLNRHRMSHSGIKNFKCSVCDASFYRLEHKQRHESRHSREPYLSCKYSNCTEKFSLKSQRITHEKSVHPNDEIKFKCPICTKIFENNYEREKHKIKVHPELAKNSCKFCTKNFITSYVLKNHSKICEKKLRLNKKN